MTLELDATAAPMRFAPGQFDMLYAPGVGEAAISISSDPSGHTRIRHTIRVVGWVTRALVGVRPGAMVGVRGPYGRPWPLGSATGGDLVVVAGGIGLAPLRPAILAALAHRDRFRSVDVHVGARAPGDLLFQDDLARWRRDPRLDVHVTVDRAERGWTGPVGVVTRSLERGGFDPRDATVLSCGPEVMLRFVARTLLGRGLAPEQLFVSLERNMRCAVGTCGHCQLGPVFVCRDGPVFAWSEVSDLVEVREL